VVLIGFAQEKANVFGAPTQKQRQRGRFAATRRSAYPNHVCFYIWDSPANSALVQAPPGGMGGDGVVVPAQARPLAKAGAGGGF
jgi:hypothetical protein